MQEVVAAKSAFLICSKKCINYNYFTLWFRLLVGDRTQKAGGVQNSLSLAYAHLFAVRFGSMAYAASEQPEASYELLPALVNS